MPDFPTFNYRTVYFFIMSLFGIIFILSLMDLIKVDKPMAITGISFVNIFVGMFGWIMQKIVDSGYEKYTLKHTSKGDLLEDLEWYRDWEIGIMITITSITFIITFIGLLIQIK